MPISSANPEKMFLYAKVGQNLNDDLRRDIYRMRYTLSDFEAKCREYPVQVSYLTDRVQAHIAKWEENEKFVQRVARDFRNADRGDAPLGTLQRYLGEWLGGLDDRDMRTLLDKVSFWLDTGVQIIIGAPLLLSLSKNGEYFNISFKWVENFGLSISAVRSFLGVPGTKILRSSLIEILEKSAAPKYIILLGIAVKWAQDFNDYSDSGTKLISALAVDALSLYVIGEVALGVGEGALWVGGVLLGVEALPVLVAIVAVVAVGATIATGYFLDKGFEKSGIRDNLIDAGDKLLSTALNWTKDHQQDINHWMHGTVLSIPAIIMAGKFANKIDNAATNIVHLNKPTGNPLNWSAKEAYAEIASYSGRYPGTIRQVGDNEYIVFLRGLDTNPLFAVDNWLPDAISDGLQHPSNYQKLMKEQILNVLPQGAQIHFVGHSQGGILSEGLAVDADINDKFEVKSVLAYGSPDTYNFSKRQYFNNQYKEINYIPINNPDDPIPNLKLDVEHLTRLPETRYELLTSLESHTSYDSFAPDTTLGELLNISPDAYSSMKPKHMIQLVDFKQTVIERTPIPQFFENEVVENITNTVRNVGNVL